MDFDTKCWEIFHKEWGSSMCYFLHKGTGLLYVALELIVTDPGLLVLEPLGTQESPLLFSRWLTKLIEYNSRFGVVLPLVLNFCSLKVNAKLRELVMFSSFSADFFVASLAGFSFLQSLVLWEEFLHL